MGKKLRVKYPVIVEGRYDKAKLASFLEGDILQTDGFRIFADKKKLALIQRLASGSKIILLTDSDRAGFQIRSHIAGAVPPGQVIHLYIPEILGKERRKAHPSAEGTLGVEGVELDILRRAFEEAGVLEEGEAPPDREPITRGDLYTLGFSGGEGSAGLRQALLLRLGLPRGVGPGALPGILTRLLTKEELTALAQELKAAQKEGS